MKNPPFSRAAQRLIGDFRGLPSQEPAKMRKRETKDLAALVEDLRNRYGIGRSTPEQTLRDNWSELVGAANAAYSHPARIDYERRLIVAVSHSVVRNELFLHRAAIVERVQKLPGCSGVTELRVVAG
jgi:hypothetical protein